MPDYIDKNNAMGWFKSGEFPQSMRYCKQIIMLENYCEFLSLHGSAEVEIRYLCAMIEHADCADDGALWVVSEKTGERQTTRSFEVVVIDRYFSDMRATNMIAAVCRSDKNGLVKVNYRSEVDQAIKAIDPRARILHV